MTIKKSFSLDFLNNKSPLKVFKLLLANKIVVSFHFSLMSLSFYGKNRSLSTRVGEKRNIMFSIELGESSFLFSFQFCALLNISSIG